MAALYALACRVAHMSSASRMLYVEVRGRAICDGGDNVPCDRQLSQALFCPVYFQSTINSVYYVTTSPARMIRFQQCRGALSSGVLAEPKIALYIVTVGARAACSTPPQRTFSRRSRQFCRHITLPSLMRRTRESMRRAAMLMV